MPCIIVNNLVPPLLHIVILRETLFRILAYGYMEGIYSSRKLEKACKRDLNFIWLLQGQKAPSHNTIARFRSERLENCVEDLFYQFVIELERRNEIEFKNLFVDGTKIEADANRYTFVWKKTTDILEEKLQAKVKKILMEISSVFNIAIEVSDSKIDIKNEIFINKELLEIKENQDINLFMYIFAFYLFEDTTKIRSILTFYNIPILFSSF